MRVVHRDRLDRLDGPSSFPLFGIVPKDWTVTTPVKLIRQYGYAKKDGSKT